MGLKQRRDRDTGPLKTAGVLILARAVHPAERALESAGTRGFSLEISVCVVRVSLLRVLGRSGISLSGHDGQNDA